MTSAILKIKEQSNCFSTLATKRKMLTITKILFPSKRAVQISKRNLARTQPLHPASWMSSAHRDVRLFLMQDQPKAGTAAKGSPLGLASVNWEFSHHSSVDFTLFHILNTDNGWKGYWTNTKETKAIVMIVSLGLFRERPNGIYRDLV